MHPSRRLPLPALAMAALAALSAAVLVLAGCAATPEGGEGADGRVRIVASTNIYGQIAEQIGGERVAVTSIIASGSQDPHSYEATARDQLAVSRAQLVIENGGGFDAFIARLIAAAGTDPVIVTAVDFAEGEAGDHDGDAHDVDADGADAHGVDDHSADADGAADQSADDHSADDRETGAHEHDGPAAGADEAHDHDNEHVWFDPAAMSRLGAQLALDLAALDPEGAETFADNAAAFSLELEAVQAEMAGIAAEHAGEGVFLSEPLAGPLVAAAVLVDVTPEGFAAAVEAGRDVSPAVLLASLRVIEEGAARVVFVNGQTAGAETKRIVDAATTANIPIVAFTETIPEGPEGEGMASYPEWMRDNVARLAAALGGSASAPTAEGAGVGAAGGADTRAHAGAGVGVRTAVDAVAGPSTGVRAGVGA